MANEMTEKTATTDQVAEPVTFDGGSILEKLSANQRRRWRKLLSIRADRRVLVIIGAALVMIVITILIIR